MWLVDPASSMRCKKVPYTRVNFAKVVTMTRPNLKHLLMFHTLHWSCPYTLSLLIPPRTLAAGTVLNPFRLFSAPLLRHHLVILLPPPQSLLLLLRFMAISGVITLYSRRIYQGSSRAWIQDVSPVLHQREGGQGLHNQGCMTLRLIFAG